MLKKKCVNTPKDKVALIRSDSWIVNDGGTSVHILSFINPQLSALCLMSDSLFAKDLIYFCVLHDTCF